jgi:hypothetical protein
MVDSLLSEHVMTSKKQPVSRPVEAPSSAGSAESRLDEALEESFPASDPIAVDLTDPHRSTVRQAPSQEKKPRHG